MKLVEPQAGLWVLTLEREACAEAGVEFLTCGISARRLSPSANLIDLIGLFKTVQRPFLFHCKSGSDRTGLAAAMYLITNENIPPEIAMRQLSLRFVHFRSGAAGVLDYMLERYISDATAEPISLGSGPINPLEAPRAS
jgi:protein tyrosine/serine phosphatase